MLEEPLLSELPIAVHVSRNNTWRMSTFGKSSAALVIPPSYFRTNDTIFGLASYID